MRQSCDPIIYLILMETLYESSKLSCTRNSWYIMKQFINTRGPIKSYNFTIYKLRTGELNSYSLELGSSE